MCMCMYVIHVIVTLFVCIHTIDGQKIAKKLCSQISKETKQIKLFLEEFNACQGDMSLSEAQDPMLIQARLKSAGHVCVEGGEKHEILQAYLAYCRSKEELVLLEREARNVVSYYEHKKEVIFQEMENQSSRGTIALLHLLLAEVNNLLEQARVTLQAMTDAVEDTDEYVLYEDSDDYATSSDDDL